MLFSFGRDVNIQWKHGVNALREDEQDGRGRVSIVLWGLTTDVIEEDKSPPMVRNAEHFGGVPRDGQRKQQNFHKNNSHGPPPAAAPPPPLSGRKVTLPQRDHRAGGGVVDSAPLFVLSEDRDRGRIERDRLERDRIERDRIERDRIERDRMDREREWERERERREEWERSHRGGGGSYTRSRSRSRERRPLPSDYPRGMDRRDYYLPPPLAAPLPPAPLPVYTQPPRDDRGGGAGGGGGAYSNPSSSNVRLAHGVCFEFVTSGTCRFGDRCKFRHER
jgi:hypothetical protein